MSVPSDGAGDHERPDDFRLERRLFILKAAAILSVATVTTVAATIATTTPAEAVTDRNPYDRPNRPVYGVRRRRCVTDRNPYDRRCRPVYR